MGARYGRAVVALLLLVVLVALPAVAHAERRVALVIGNANYRDAPLQNPANDARAMAEVLADAGFEVRTQINLSQRQMKQAIQDFGRRLEAAGKDAVGLFYFAGHGIQVNGENYLIPVGHNIRREPDVDMESVSAAHVLSMMEYSGNKLNVVILDACRNNPFKRSFRSVPTGLARMDAPIGSLVAYATAPGSVAEDGEGQNGVYTEELVRAMRTPGARIEDVFKSTRVAVLRRTDDLQVPWESSSLTGDFYFFSPPAGEGATTAIAALPEDVSEEVEANRAWVRIADSGDADALRKFIKDYPNSALADLARRRLAALERKAEEAPAAPAASPAPPTEARASARPAPAQSERARLQAELNRRLQAGLNAPSVPRTVNAAPLVDTVSGEAVTGAQAQAIRAQCDMFYDQMAAMGQVMGGARSVAQAAMLQQQRMNCQRYGLTGR